MIKPKLTRIGPLPDTFFLGSARVEPERRQVILGRRCVRLSPRTIQVLLYMASRPKQTLPHDELIRAVWGGAIVGDEVLFKAVSELRAALGDSARASRIIETIPKTGYRLLVTPNEIQQKHRPLVLAAAIGVFVMIGAMSLLWISSQPSVNGESRRLIQKAVYLMEHGDHKDGKHAVNMLNGAIKIDPNDANARALLGKALLKNGDWASARIALDAAVQIESGLVLALVTRARIALQYEWDWQTSRQMMERAKIAEPDNPMVYVGLAAWHASIADHATAIAYAQRAVELDPVSPVVKGNLAYYYYVADDFDAVLRETDRVLELEPDDRLAVGIRFEALLALGNFDDARPMAEFMLRYYGASDEESQRLRKVADIGFETAYLAQIQQLLASHPEALEIETARILAKQGKRVAALSMIRRAVESRSTYIPFVLVDPHFQSLHDDVELRTLLQQLGHPMAANVGTTGRPKTSSSETDDP